MTAATTPQPPAPSAPERPGGKRHWLRWIIAATATLVVLIGGLVVVAIKLQPTPAPLALPTNAAAALGPVEGTYQAASGSVAGFRIQQTVIGLTSDVVGRTNDITGTVTIVGGQVTTAGLRVGLLALTSGGGKPAPQFGISLDTQRYPDATIGLAQPVTLDAAFTSGTTVTPMQPWENILEDATELARDSQILLLIGAWLLGLLAVASLSVLVGGRMADQTRRVGLLKAVGGTPGLVAAVLLAEYLLVAVVAAAAALAIGALTAPLLTESSAGLIGSAGTPSMTMSTAGLVTAVALGVAVVATVVPAVRAARSSTVSALADSPRPPRRIGWLIAISARLPVPLLLALRVAARRPRRVMLGVVSIAITVSGIYVLLVLNAFLTTQPLAGGYDDAQGVAAPRAPRLDGHTALPGGGQRHRHHLGDGARQPAFVGAGARSRRNPW